MVVVPPPVFDLHIDMEHYAYKDLTLDIFNTLNPLLPDNTKVPPEGQMWVVEVWTEENPKEEAPKEGTTPAPSTAEVKVKDYPTKRTMTAIIEVVIVERSSAEDGTKFILESILKPGRSPVSLRPVLSKARVC